MGLARKRDAVERLGADVLVIPEAARDAPPAGDAGVTSVWSGTRPGKGLGVYARNGWRVAPAGADDDPPWTLSTRALDPGGVERFTLVAVWTVAGRGRPSYTRQLALLVDRFEDELRAGTVVLAGDFNASTDDSAAGRAHARNVERLHDLGLESAYHAHTGHAHGREEAMTLRWVGRGRIALEYHCDFVFLPRHLLDGVRAVTVGTMTEWVDSGLSDHAPVTVELAMDQAVA
jgi:endonuclease/exonuclease/phosphatase (EEP) superfamily protein YafD